FGVLTESAGTDQPPRYVLVELPDHLDRDQVAVLLPELSEISDPGAPGGQWDFMNLAPRTKGEFASAEFPSVTELQSAVIAGSTFVGVPGVASIDIMRDRGHHTPLRIEIVAFDDAMDEVTSDEAEVAFAQTKAWAQ